jgi:hypothetical protein
MRTMLALAALALALAAPAAAAPADDVARLAWMAGTWIDEKPGVTTRETWLAPLGGAMAGASQANRPGKPAFIEHVKITAEPAGATYTASLSGQAPVPFVLLPGGKDGEAVFENKDHDFPQRILYRRCGEALCARIEGLVRGKLEAEEWRYRRLP